jgi:hypothetical protein
MQESNGQLQVEQKHYGIIRIAEYLHADENGYIFCEKRVKLFGITIYSSVKYEREFDKIGWQKPESERINKAA